MPFKGGKTWGARAGGRQSHPPPVWKRSEARLISRGHSAEEALAEKWAMRMFTPHSTYPPWAVMGLPCYFLHALALLDSCEGLRRLLAAHGIPLHLSPACWACCGAGRLTTSLPPTRHRPAPPLQSHGLGNDSPYPKDIQIIFQVTPTMLAHPSPAVSHNNNMPEYCRHSERPLIFQQHIAGLPFFLFFKDDHTHTAPL